jgi:hypothetical protein
MVVMGLEVMVKILTEKTVDRITRNLVITTLYTSLVRFCETTFGGCIVASV